MIYRDQMDLLPPSLILFSYVQYKFGRKELARSQNRNHNGG